MEHARERVENNSALIRRYFYRQRFKARWDIDISRDVRLGADIMSAYYRDKNILYQPGVEAAYYFSFEPRLFYLRYRWEYMQFKDKTADYWSPQGFWTSSLRAAWRHYLNRQEIFFGADDIYYELAYELSLDRDGNIGSRFAFGLYYDINKRLSIYLNAALFRSSSDVYRDLETAAGIRYYF